MHLVDIMGPDGRHLKPEFTRKWKYVWSDSSPVRTPWGIVKPPLGFLSDGASCVHDLTVWASAVHDWLYAMPYVVTESGDRVRIRRVTCDRIYGYQLRRHGWPLISLWRVAGLWAVNTMPGSPWRRHRAREASMGEAGYLTYLRERRQLPMAYGGLWQHHASMRSDMLRWGGAVLPS